MTPTALDDLRGATADAHRALDTGLDIRQRLARPATRLDLVQGYFAMHAAAEAAVAPRLRSVEGLDLPRRCRSARIRESLDRLGAAPVVPPPLSVSNDAEALGVLYVMEGASLGGRVILRGLDAAGVATTPVAFLDPYGAQAGTMWRALVVVLERELHDLHRRRAAIAGAHAAFALANLCLRPGGVASPAELAVVS